MLIKKDDIVEVITGDDKGKRGRVLSVQPRAGKIVAVQNLEPGDALSPGQVVAVIAPSAGAGVWASNGSTPEAETWKPLLDQIDPSKWEVPGGNEGYVRQHQQSLTAIDHLANVSQRLAVSPARLSIALEALLRMEHFVSQVQSFSEGVRRYQNPAVAELLESELTRVIPSRDWLRTHVTDLAATREKELEVAEKEAQKCREQTQKQGVRK